MVPVLAIILLFVLASQTARKMVCRQHHQEVVAVTNSLSITSTCMRSCAQWQMLVEIDRKVRTSSIVHVSPAEPTWFAWIWGLVSNCKATAYAYETVRVREQMAGWLHGLFMIMSVC